VGEEIETLHGTVARIAFRAAEGDFAVVRLRVIGDQKVDSEVTVVGSLGGLLEGERLLVEGTWERHASFGRQFRVHKAAVELPQTAAGVQRYLEGLEGIGARSAERLVAAFGKDAIEVVEKEPWRVAQVPGMGRSRADRAHRDALGRKEEREATVFLQGFGISLAYARRIRKFYGAAAVGRVRENPYRLSRDVPGIGFQVADRIAQSMGIERDSPLRMEAGLLYTLEKLADDGHACASHEHLLAHASELLSLNRDGLVSALAALIADGALVEEGANVYLRRLHSAEVEAAAAALALLHADRQVPPKVTPPIHLGEAQKRAIALVGQAGMVVVTGGPGTGKTTLLRALVDAWEADHRKVLVAAPTGRAARRLTEATGRSAVTVHRLLEWGRAGERRRVGFGRDRANPLEADLIVVDEASMLDILLARALLLAIRPGTRLILVGDVDQLPPVGPGQVLSDLIHSGVVPVARLDQVFRQAGGSRITENAYRILHGELPVPAPKEEPKADFYFIEISDPERVHNLVVRLCRDRIPSAFGFHSRREVQVLSPMRRGTGGTDELNLALQAAFANRELAGRRELRVGDKVMQVRNDYDRDVYNGDVGLVAAVTETEAGIRITVDFEGRPVEYEGESVGDLELAYAMTVHKSQGSEYPAVVLVLLPQHRLLLQRNLLYTAVTRAKRLLILVGSGGALRWAVENSSAERRSTGLCARLRGAGVRMRES
jgi:exodeoxyribonuclease V alpha subunit